MPETWRRIGALSRETGVRTANIRFYEQIGLMPQARRSEGDWRLYGDEARKRLAFIRHARDLGFSVDDIRTLLAVAAHPERPCDDIEAVTRAQLAAVERKLTHLSGLRDELQRMAECCAGGLAAECRIIEALSEQTPCDGHASTA